MPWSGRMSVVVVLLIVVCSLLPVFTARANKRALDRPPAKKSKLYLFLILCTQQGLNTRQHKEILGRDNHLTTKISRFFIGHLIHMNSSSVERGLELDVPVPSRNQTSLHLKLVSVGYGRYQFLLLRETSTK